MTTMAQAPTSPKPRPRTFSLHSDKSSGSKVKGDLNESPADKQRRDSIWKLSSKANPNAALNEAQPGSTFTSLSLIPPRTIVYTPLFTRSHHGDYR